MKVLYIHFSALYNLTFGSSNQPLLAQVLHNAVMKTVKKSTGISVKIIVFIMQ